MILIQCYSGWRPGEFVSLRTEHIDLTGMKMTGGGKTKAGKNRIVPIHPKILPLMRVQYLRAKDAGAETLFFEKPGGKRLTYDKYHEWFGQEMARICPGPLTGRMTRGRTS